MRGTKWCHGLPLWNMVLVSYRYGLTIPMWEGYTQGGSRGLQFKLSYFGIGHLVVLLEYHVVLLA